MAQIFLLEEKKINKDGRTVGVESETLLHKQMAVKAIICIQCPLCQNGEFFEGRHNGTDIVNWQVEKGGFGWK